MNILQTLTSNSVVYQLGWTLLHSLWQAAVVAVVLAIVLETMPARRSNRRYVASCLALICVCAMCVGTYVRLGAMGEFVVTSDIPNGSRLVENVPRELARAGSRHAFGETSLGVVETEAATMSSPSDTISDHRLSVDGAMPWLVAAWMFGAMSVAVWHLGGLVMLQRTCKRAKVPAKNIVQLARDCAEQLGVRRVSVLCSPIVVTPAVVGIMQPVLLLPTALVARLTTQELRAVLSHELAHIRRHDFLVNLLQAVVESLLFYHPAVCWISRCIRAERENCCDDLASAAVGNRFDYARALTTVSEHVAKPSPSVLVAASSVNIEQRIHRLLSPPRQISVLATAAQAGLLVLIVASTGIAVAMNSGPQESKVAETGDVKPEDVSQGIGTSPTTAHDKTTPKPPANKRKVLMVDSAATWHFRLLNRLLRREESVMVHMFLQNRMDELDDDPIWLESFPDKDDLMAYDVIVLGNVDPASLDRADVENIKSFVEVRGGGLLLVAGQKNCPWKYDKGPLQSLLPVEAKDIRATTHDTMPSLSAQALNLAAFHLAESEEESRRLWKELPPLRWCAAAPRVKPDATVLASFPTEDRAEIPVFVARYHGPGRVMYHATSYTWRWRGHDRGEEVYRKFWLGTVAFLAKAKNADDARVSAVLEHRHDDIKKSSETKTIDVTTSISKIEIDGAAHEKPSVLHRAAQNKQDAAPETLSSDWSDDLKKVQGAWNVVRHWTSGTGFGTLDGSGDPLGPRVFIAGNKITLQLRPKDPTRDKYEYVIKRVDESTKPKQIDVSLKKDNMTVVRKGIYLLEKDMIRCEFASPDQPRPTQFQAAIGDESSTNFLILRRVKHSEDSDNEQDAGKDAPALEQTGLK